MPPKFWDRPLYRQWYLCRWGYELALACDEILLIDDANSAVSLPSTAFGGIAGDRWFNPRGRQAKSTQRFGRLFCTVARRQRQTRFEMKLVDAIAPKSKWDDAVANHAADRLKAVTDLVVKV